MNIISEEEEIKEIKIEDLVGSEDKGVVIHSEVGKRDKGEDELTKELVAYDAINLGASEAAKINGVPQSSASKYKDGKDVKEETKENILSVRHQIEDKTITKLMATLDLFNPADIDKPIDLVNAASKLSGIVEKIHGRSKDGSSTVLHFHLPNQKKVEDYEVIEVG